MSESPKIKPILLFYWRELIRYPRLLISMLSVHPFAILFLRFLPPLIVAGILAKINDQDYIKGDLWNSFGPSLLLAIGLEALGGIIIWRIVIYFNFRLEGLVVRDLHRKVFNHLLKLDANFHSDHFGGSLVSQTSKLVSSYIRIVDTTVFEVLGLFWALIFTSIILAPKAPLYVVALIIFTILYMTYAVLTTSKIRRLGASLADRENKQTGHLADAITNVMAVKSFARGKFENERYAEISESSRQSLNKLMWATLKRETGFGGIGTLIDAVALVLSIGSVVLFDANVAVVFLVLAYTGDILQRLWDFSNQALRNYNRSFGDAQAMIDILATEPQVKDPVNPEEVRIKNGAINFDRVDFAHPDSRQEDALFNGLSIDIQPGEKIGLVGHSGSGKTSFTRLLLRFNDVDNGQILIDGQNIASITQDDLRQHIAYVPQEPLLFHRSISENISYGKPGANHNAVKEAARKAHALEFIEKLPSGFETLVGERGVKLSGGQRQRVAIARAIVKDAPILVLDEATSALDSESERLIQAALWELMKGRTAIVIAHRLSTIQKMDRIIVLDNGKIIEHGSHQQLLKNKNTYAKLWKHQSGGFLEE